MSPGPCPHPAHCEAMPASDWLACHPVPTPCVCHHLTLDTAIPVNVCLTTECQLHEDGFFSELCSLCLG